MNKTNELPRNLRKFKKINFGSGHDKRAGYLNVDVDEACNPDLLVPDGDYSIIPKHKYNEILANDVLEHISRSKTLEILLDWSEFLTLGSKLKLQTSSILGVAEQLKKHEKFSDHYGWTTCLFGNQAHPGDFHHTGFTEATLKVHLLAAGYKIISFKLEDLWLFHVECEKVYDLEDTVKANSRKSNEEFANWLFQEAFGRDPDELGGAHILNALNTGALTKHEAARHLFNSPERLYYTAALNKY